MAKGFNKGPQMGQGGIRQSADNNKTAGFRLTVFAHAEEVRAFRHALLPREAHGPGAARRRGLHPVLGRVAGVVQLGTLGDQTLAALLAAPLDDVAAGLGRHAGAESVLALAGALGRLEGAFHGGESRESAFRLPAARWNSCSGPAGRAL